MYQLSDEILSFYRQTQESKRLTDAYLHRPEELNSEVVEEWQRKLWVEKSVEEISDAAMKLRKSKDGDS